MHWDKIPGTDRAEAFAKQDRDRNWRAEGGWPGQAVIRFEHA